MKKEFVMVVFIVVVAVVILSAASVSWYLWQSKQPPSPIVPSNPVISDSPDQVFDQTSYSNTKYNYSLKYPNDWFFNYFSDSKEEANVVWVVSNQQDLEIADGGPPRGVRMEVIVQDLSELKEVDTSFPDMATVYDWLEWQRAYQVSFDSESMGEPKDENVTVGGIRAVKTYYEDPLYDEMAKTIVVTLLDPVKERIYEIQYLGSEPAFSENKSVYENFLTSFTFGF